MSWKSYDACSAMRNIYIKENDGKYYLKLVKTSDKLLNHFLQRGSCGKKYPNSPAPSVFLIFEKILTVRYIVFIKLHQKAIMLETPIVQILSKEAYWLQLKCGQVTPPPQPSIHKGSGL